MSALLAPRQSQPVVRRWRAGLPRRLRMRGQAMIEYSVITHTILIGGTLLLLPMVAKLLNAFDTFYQGVYLVLETGAL